MSKFQLVVILIILVLVFVSFLILSGAVPGLPGLGSANVVNLTMWGTLTRIQMYGAINLNNDQNRDSFLVEYVEKVPANYETELVNALASGTGPDIWFLTQDLILKHKDKAFIISFETLKERDFKNLFADIAELYLTKDSVIAVPFLIDPIVLYWNRDLFNKVGLAMPPANWNQFLSYVQLLTEKEQFTGNISQSGAAMGEFSNVKNAKEIISFLIQQGGNNIVDKDNLNVILGDKGTAVIDPAVSALNFYLNFSNPSKISYSWNRALPSSKNMFLSGKLAMYFGYASEFDSIKEGNPHLNFDIATIPQTEGIGFKTTYGKIYGLAVSKSSSNLQTALNAVFAFTSKDVLSQLQTDTLLPSPRRDLLSENPINPQMSVFFKAALQSRSWLEPDSQLVNVIFKDMIESVVTGKRQVSSAIIDARSKLQTEMQKVK